MVSYATPFPSTCLRRILHASRISNEITEVRRRPIIVHAQVLYSIPTNVHIARLCTHRVAARLGSSEAMTENWQSSTPCTWAARFLAQLGMFSAWA